MTVGCHCLGWEGGVGLILECFGVYGAHPGLPWVLYGVNPERPSSVCLILGYLGGYRVYPGMFLGVCTGLIWRCLVGI